jgi:transposase InsO family protein
MHPLARTTPWSRREIVELVAAGVPIAGVARRFAISRTTVYKWLDRHAEGGLPALEDRPPTAHFFPTKISKSIERQVERLRRRRRLLGWQIAEALGLARSTVIKILKRLTLARLRDIDPPRVTQRYEYANLGELVHIDIKKIARFEAVGHRIHGDRRRRSRRIGFDAVYVAVDDCTRYGHLRIYEDESGEAAADFLRRIILRFARRGITVQRVMTDNGKVFLSHAFQGVLSSFGVKHILTPPFTPQWNGKAERFIQSLLRECAYAVSYRDSYERNLALVAWNRYYNQDRRHAALNYLTPARRWAQICKRSA